MQYAKIAVILGRLYKKAPCANREPTAHHGAACLPTPIYYHLECSHAIDNVTNCRKKSAVFFMPKNRR